MNVANQESTFPSEGQFSPDRACLPTLSEITAIMRKGKCRRGHGEDGLPAELFAAFPEELGRMMWPLWLKATARIEEPLAWKGGMLAELMKAGGAPLDCDGYRGIFVTDVAGKQLHGWYRRCLMPSYRTITRPTQFGDVEHMGTDFCSHMARAY